MTTKNTALGERIHNPLNIRYTARNPWLGLNPNCPNVKGFCHFISIELGLRAAVCLVRTYMRRYGLVTPRSIITRWAPPTENNTALYLAAVCGRCGLHPDHPLSPDINTVRTNAFTLSSDISRLVSAMARQETGMEINPLLIDDVRRQFHQ